MGFHDFVKIYFKTNYNLKILGDQKGKQEIYFIIAMQLISWLGSVSVKDKDTVFGLSG